MLETVSQYRRFLITGLLIFFSIGFLGFFTEREGLSPVFQGFIVSVAFFLVIPVFYSKIVLKESLKNLGLDTGNASAGVFASIACVILGSSALVALVLAFPDFRAGYTFPVLVETSFFWFIAYELLLVPLVLFLYEVFFRGLVQFLWLRAFGLWAVLAQAVLFCGFLYLSDDISWQTAPLLLFAPLSGLIAYRAQSIWYSFAAGWAFLFLTDVFLLIFH